jgi:DNA polymerase II large subunit
MTPQDYKEQLHEESLRVFERAQAARARGYDPETTVEVKLAKNMAERVVGLVSVIAPQIVGSGIAERIVELEREYGVLDWRVSLQIALDVARQQFCSFKNTIEAIEVGIRIGFAYATVGVVSSPLEGFVNLEIKQRLDGKGNYFCLNFAGPVRNAGGTAAAQCVVIADYVRVKLGYAEYDPTDDEVNRCAVELDDYHERVTILQYKPSKEESEFLLRKLPIEISGDGSERIDVSNYKNLPRVPTNKIRSGYCLLHSSCIPLKAPKLWKQLESWGNDFGMEHWSFLHDFIKLQKKMQSGKVKRVDGATISPNYTYISDLVAGRPVFGHPLQPGAFRLRYGRARTSGLSAQALHPATMHVLRNFIASGTQLKVERPGKAAACSVCDSIEGPIVKLHNGSVLRIDTEEQARALKKDITEILFAGDILICYGDFSNRNHVLCPAGYCEEWWVQEVEAAIATSGKSIEELSERTNLSLATLLANPFERIPFSSAMRLTDELRVPLHPYYTYYWSLISQDQMRLLLTALLAANLTTSGNCLEKIIIPKGPEKRVLEELGVPHTMTPDHVVLEESALPLIYQCGVASRKDIEDLLHEIDRSEQTVLTILASRVPLRDKAGTFIGTRMGRPEKAKMRTLASTPHGLFPVGEQGGRLRSIQSALDKRVIVADAALYVCDSCSRETLHRRCPCGGNAEPAYWHTRAGVLRELPPNLSSSQNSLKEFQTWKKQNIPIRDHLNQCLKMLSTNVHPDLIKGVRGMSGRDHHAEHLIKAFLRAKYELGVNKDGTVRYDASETPLTHFTPREVGTSVERLLELGYDSDMAGTPLTRDDQVLSLKPQDVVLPGCPDSPDERCDDVLFRATKFIDDLLVAYGEKPFYQCQSRDDLAGHLIVGLAPHTSAGTVGRIVGFSKTQGLLCHPYFHCAMRRDCDGDEGCVFLLFDAFLNFSKAFLPTSRGGTMDAPLVLTTALNPAEVDDMVFDMDTATRYPKELYEAALEYKNPREIIIPQVKRILGSPHEDTAIGYTHPVSDINAGVLCSSYKTLPSMKDKLEAQMKLAEELRSVDEQDVARLVIEKHFIRDVKGNLRKFSTQEFRCVSCNAKYRRPPITRNGACTACGGKVTFTISEGSVVKYLEPMESLGKTYKVAPYLMQSIELTRRRVEEVFGKDSESQTGLGAWFG